MRSGPGAARTILLVYTISARPSKQPRILGTRSTLRVYSLGLILVSVRTKKDIIILYHHLHPCSTLDFRQGRACDLSCRRTSLIQGLPVPESQPFPSFFSFLFSFTFQGCHTANFPPHAIFILPMPITQYFPSAINDNAFSTLFHHAACLPYVTLRK